MPIWVHVTPTSVDCQNLASDTVPLFTSRVARRAAGRPAATVVGTTEEVALSSLAVAYPGYHR